MPDASGIWTDDDEAAPDTRPPKCDALGTRHSRSEDELRTVSRNLFHAQLQHVVSRHTRTKQHEDKNKRQISLI